MKKGQGLSMNVIIIAAIALLVLVVLIAVFSGRMGLFNKDLNKQTGNDCSTRGGDCRDFCESDEVIMFGADCPTGEKCCAFSGYTYKCEEGSEVCIGNGGKHGNDAACPDSPCGDITPYCCLY